MHGNEGYRVGYRWTALNQMLSIFFYHRHAGRFARSGLYSVAVKQERSDAAVIENMKRKLVGKMGATVRESVRAV